jgi:phosphatidylethanolamine-binding protein (PEBP) family uncharacterized protein
MSLRTTHETATTKGDDPYARLPQVASFVVSSTTVCDGDPWPPAQMHVSVGSRDVSPQLSWSGLRRGRRVTR